MDPFRYLEGIVRACSELVVHLDRHPRGAFLFVVVLALLCVAWRWPLL